jgi:hypothetical protein
VAVEAQDVEILTGPDEHQVRRLGKVIDMDRAEILAPP